MLPARHGWLCGRLTACIRDGVGTGPGPVIVRQTAVRRLAIHPSLPAAVFHRPTLVAVAWGEATEDYGP